MPRNDRNVRVDEQPEFDERVIDIARVAKVVKGGRHFSFRTVVVVGDNKGRVGVGVGKSRAVPDAIRKGTERARHAMKPIPLSPGTGVIAAGGVRAVLEAAGVRDILTKSLGSANTLNVVEATVDALEHLYDPAKLAAMRGKPAESLKPFWERRKSD
jgi:small subunit ribosomal protein S5